MKRWAAGLLAVAVGASSAFAADLAPTDFAYGLVVETSADDAAYRVPLPVAAASISGRSLARLTSSGSPFRAAG